MQQLSRWGEVVIEETELLAANHLSPGLRSPIHSRAEWRGFPEAP